MGKTRDLFKKIGDTKGTFCAKMGTIKTEIARKDQGESRKSNRTVIVLQTGKEGDMDCVIVDNGHNSVLGK